MTPQEALKKAQLLYQEGRYVIGFHARQRMNERNVKQPDMDNAMLNATGCRAGYAGRWMIEGADQEGDSLTVVVQIQDNLLIITVRE